MEPLNQPSALTAGAGPALGRGPGSIAILGIVILAGFLGALAMLLNGRGEPIVLMLLALLASIGAFMLFGVAFGLIRVGAQADDGTLVHMLVDALPEGVQVSTADGRIVYANSAFHSILGVAAGEGLAGLEQALAGEPQAGQAIYRLFLAAERGEALEEELQVRRLGVNGRQARWLRLGIKPVPLPNNDANEKPLVLWRVADVTSAHARQEEAARHLEETVDYYDSVPAGFMTIGADGTIEAMNATLAGWLKFDRAKLADRGLKLADILTSDGATLLAPLNRAPKGRTVRLDIDLVCEDGHDIPARIVATAGESGGPTRALVLSRAPGEAHDEDARAAEVRLARFFHAAPFGIATVTATGFISSANAAFARMFFVDGGAQPASLSELMAKGGGDAAAQAVEAELQRVQAGGRCAEPVEISFGPAREFTRRVHMRSIADQAGKGGSVVLFVTDTTEQKALEVKYAQSQKMEAVGQLAGGVAHDFNNVLTVIIGLSDLLLQNHRPTDSAYGDIMQIKQNANRAAGLVRQLLAFSRRQTLNPEVMELNESISELGYSLKRLIGEKIDLKSRPARDLWYVKADPTQFQQLMINLCVNAADAMPGDGELVIRTRNVTERELQTHNAPGLVPGEYVVIEFADTGVGMAPEVLSKIFEPFFTTKEVGKGTGLGLSTVYGIVKQTGGYIYADSEVGNGTTFRIYLPRYIPEDDSELPATPDKKELPKDLTGTGRVLLVEDEDAVRNFAVRALKRQGYEVLEAATGLEALEIMDEEAGRIDIVVSDVVMPEMDGPTLLKALRKRNPKLKIIFVSGYSADAFQKSLDENEEFAFLPKPFTLPQLAAKVKETLTA